MTLKELSKEYRSHAVSLATRLKEVEQLSQAPCDSKEKSKLEERIRILSAMLREARELAHLTEHYYERGYQRNGKYTL